MSHQLRAENGRIEPLSKKQSYRVGRSESSDIFIDLEAVSKHHAIFEWTSAGWGIADLGSRNGTFVNGTKLELDVQLMLSPGDRISFNCSAKYIFEESANDYLGAVMDATIPQSMQALVSELKRDMEGLEARWEQGLQEQRREQAEQSQRLEQVLQEQEQARHARQLTARKVESLSDAFDQYQTMDGARFQGISSQLTELTSTLSSVIRLGGFGALVVIAAFAITSKDDTRLAKWVDAFGGPEVIAPVVIFLISGKETLGKAFSAKNKKPEPLIQGMDSEEITPRRSPHAMPDSALSRGDLEPSNSFGDRH